MSRLLYYSNLPICAHNTLSSPALGFFASLKMNGRFDFFPQYWVVTWAGTVFHVFMENIWNLW